MCSVAWAQLDPASSLLIKRPAGTTATTKNLDSGRYTIKNTDKEKAPSVSAEEALVKPAPGATQSAQRVGQGELQKASPADVPIENANKNKSEKVLDKDVEKNQGNNTDLKVDTEELSPGDRRSNIMNISVATGFMYLDAASDYWFKKYSSSSPTMAIEAEVWFSPEIGLSADYMTSLVADISAEHDSDRSVLVDHRITRAGLMLRKFGGTSVKSPHVIFGINYSEYQMVVPKAEASRIGIKHSGIGLFMNSYWPTELRKHWRAGVELAPKIKIDEEDTQLQLKAGSNLTAYSIKLTVGRDYILDRQNQLFWRLSHRLDRAVYDGTASDADPITGLTPQGVKASTGLTLLEIGFTWGD